jgi:carbamoyl-phosphate synthase large subunit
MPRRSDLHRILVIGSGPIIIGQAAEFDYSGTQATKALKEEGYEVILINSNPATIMTDPEFADRTYVEPVTPEFVELILEKERPDAILPTMGGQTALNVAMALSESGALQKYGVELIGATAKAIALAEDRRQFGDAMHRIGLAVAPGGIAESYDEAEAILETTGFPAIIRPSYTLGGTGGGIAYNRAEFEEIVRHGLDQSPTHQVLVERSVIGWKEFELEVMRDHDDNVVIVCSIENIDPMGVHTGDSITIAPAMTLTDREYQTMRDAAVAIIREVGVDAGGCNIQFAINPRDGEMLVIEMNPRVSRSSALASKATGFPIARIGAKLAVGYRLDEIANDITKTTPASFEPVLDYVVVKVPRFAFEKFPQADDRLTTQMKSVGEVMAIGRNFQESLQKALRGLETGVDGFNLKSVDMDKIEDELAYPRGERLWYVADAFGVGMSLEDIHRFTKIDPWFLVQIKDLVDTELEIEKKTLADFDREALYGLKRKGFSDRRLAYLWKTTEHEVRGKRHALGIRPVYKRVDTCAAEFETGTAYMYSSYDEEDESKPTNKRKIMVLGGGPNRIGQGIEFDYCCVHAALALREDGFETIMVNCNPETVSTDYDTSDRLYFEPLTLEDVLEIVDKEKPEGVIVQFGGQTPLKLARDLEAAGVPIIGTSPDSIDRAEDRERFQQMLHELKLLQPPNRTARTEEAALEGAKQIGYPVIVRPSYVLGGRAMEIVHAETDLRRYMREAVKVSNDSPVLIDRFLNDAIEVDVDAICDGKDVFIGGIMEHIEQAGVHSGDSACSLPPFSLSPRLQDELRSQTVAMAKALNVVGLMNVQFAIQDDKVYVLEVNPRASRTVPYVSKAIGIPLAKVAARCMVGQSLVQQRVTREVIPPYYCVKEAVFPFIKFPGVDTILGPEMKSTGEVMGVGQTFAEAFVKSQLAAGVRLPKGGKAFLSVRDADKARAVEVGRALTELGFSLVATRGTAAALEKAGLKVQPINKVQEGRPHIVDMLKNREVNLIINTVEEDRRSIQDSWSIRNTALQNKITYYTTIAGARAACMGMRHLEEMRAYDIQSLHESLPK